MDDATYDQGRPATAGAELRGEREAQGLTLADVADRTRIPRRHLEAIETGDYAVLPAATYSTGFVRTYARLLGLDASSLSQRFRNELSEQQPVQSYRQEPYEPADPARVPSRGLAWVAVLVAVVLAVGYLYWRGNRLETPSEVALAPAEGGNGAPKPAAAPPASTPAPAVPIVPVAGQTALLTAEQPVWMRITDADVGKLFQGMLEPGQTFQVPATATDPRLRTSRVTALKVTVGSTVIPPLGPAETLVKDVSLKPDALLARVTAGAAPPAATVN